MRTENDLQGIRRYEGEEAYQRALAEEGRAPPPSEKLDGALGVLLQLAKELNSPAVYQKKLDALSDLHKKAQAERSALVAERRSFERDRDRDLAEHQARIEREVKEHEAMIAAGRAELDAAKKEIAELKAHAVADAAKAAGLKQSWMKKLSAFEAA